MPTTKERGPLTRNTKPGPRDSLAIAGWSTTRKTITVVWSGVEYTVYSSAVIVGATGTARPKPTHMWDVVNGWLTCRTHGTPRKPKAPAAITAPTASPAPGLAPPTAPHSIDQKLDMLATHGQRVNDRLAYLEASVAHLTALVTDLHGALFTPPEGN